jgi:hypothetical protein
MANYIASSKRLLMRAPETVRPIRPMTSVDTVKLLGESREFGELAGEQGRFGLCGVLDVADVVPRLEGAGPLGAVLGCRHAVAGQEEEVVDLVVGGQEALNMPGRLEPLHLPFSSPCWLV